MATIWEDNFESGNALSVSYTNISNSETNATCGRNGGWGCRTTGTDIQKYQGYFGWESSTFVETNYFRATFDSDRSSSRTDQVGGWCIYVNDIPNSWNGLIVELDHGMPDDDTILRLYTYWGFDPYESATGALTPGTWQTVVVEGWFSTQTETSPGEWTPNFDGRVRVQVDGTTVIDENNIQMGGSNAITTGINGVAGIHVGPMGNGDNIGLYDAEPPIIDPYTWVDVADFLETEIYCAVNTVAMRVTADAWAAQAVPMKLRLYSITDDTVCGTSDEITSSVPVDASFDVRLLVGHGKYKLQAGSETPNVDLFAIGMLSPL